MQTVDFVKEMYHAHPLQDVYKFIILQRMIWIHFGYSESKSVFKEISQNFLFNTLTHLVKNGQKHGFFNIKWREKIAIQSVIHIVGVLAELDLNTISIFGLFFFKRSCILSKLLFGK